MQKVLIGCCFVEPGYFHSTNMNTESDPLESFVNDLSDLSSNEFIGTHEAQVWSAFPSHTGEREDDSEVQLRATCLSWPNEVKNAAAALSTSKEEIKLCRNMTLSAKQAHKLFLEMKNFFNISAGTYNWDWYVLVVSSLNSILNSFIKVLKIDHFGKLSRI